MRADRRHQPLPLPARLLEARATADSVRRRRQSPVRRWRGSRASSRFIGSDSSPARHSRCSSGGGPAARSRRIRPPRAALRRRPGEPERQRPAGSVACLTIPGRASRRTAAGTASRSPSRRPRSPPAGLVQDQLPAGDPRQQLDRSIVVRRPEPAGGDAQVGRAAPSRSAASRSSASSPTMISRAGSNPSETELARGTARSGPRRCPWTSSEPVRTTAARGRRDRLQASVGQRQLDGPAPCSGVRNRRSASRPRCAGSRSAATDAAS